MLHKKNGSVTIPPARLTFFAPALLLSCTRKILKDIYMGLSLIPYLKFEAKLVCLWQLPLYFHRVRTDK